MTPFPSLHTTANSAADEHVHDARRLAEQAESFLADLDAVLDEAEVTTTN